jgi:tRNA-modifying protein YgfZ
MSSPQFFSQTADWVKISGPDAKDFLHRLTTTDFRNLLPGESSQGFFLTAQGKIRAGFQVYALPAISSKPEVTYLFRIPRSEKHGWVEKLLTVIDQFTFSEKMTIERVTPSFSMEILADPGFTAPPEESLISIPWGSRAYGKEWISLLSLNPQFNGSQLSVDTHQNADPEEIEEMRVRALSPNWENEIQPDASPLELGMREWIADNKGCYPGQEVIEKVISLGSPAKKLCLFRLDSATQDFGQHPALSPLSPLFSNGEEVGLLTSRSGNFALGILKRNGLQNTEFSTEKTARGEWKLVKH